MGLASVTDSRPFHLRGNFAPVTEEVTAFDLPVEGAIPREIRGRYLRNGPNPRDGQSGHWFFGDGMVHGVELGEGRVRWYRNRWVRTRTFTEGARLLSPEGEVDVTAGVANTHVIGHAGRVLALVESSLPTELTPELDTVGCYDFGGKLKTAMTAHPKICPRTGEMHFFGYGFMPPFLTYHRATAAGELVESQVIEVPGPTMIHDFAITEHHVVFMDLPVCFDLERVTADLETMPYRWRDDYGARIGVMPRGGAGGPGTVRGPGGAGAIRWYEIEPCYVFHPLNAYEAEGGRLVVEVARYESLWRDDPGRFEPARLHRWTVDPAAGRVREEQLDERAIEFPRVDERRVGRRHRYGYAVTNNLGVGVEMTDVESASLIKYDLATGRAEMHDFGEHRIPSEGVFVPAAEGAGEDEGWVLAFVYDRARNGSDLVILDAANFRGRPVATVRLPQRVPYGFHGSFIAE
jgi:carotenoid cleavage dioxygenase